MVATWNKSKLIFWGKNIACLVLKLTVYVRNFSSFFISQKPREIRHYELFWRNLQFWPMCYWKLAILRLGHVYDVIVTQYVRCLHSLWYVWKEETHSYTMVPLRCFGGSVFKFTGGGYHPFWLTVLQKKGLVRRVLSLQFAIGIIFRLQRSVWQTSIHSPLSPNVPFYKIPFTSTYRHM